MPKLTPKIILEGTRLTFKTDTAFALHDHPRFTGERKYRYHHPVVSGEWCGLTPSPWGRGLINFSAEEEARALEAFATWVRLWELLPHYCWIVDRFHLSTIMHQRLHEGREYDFRWLEERLATVGFHLAVLTRSEESFESAREKRLLVSGNPGQYGDLDRFRREQVVMRELAAQSILPMRFFDVSDDDVPRVTEEIVDWMESTGGLYPTL
jgi:hypothetical protein